MGADIMSDVGDMHAEEGMSVGTEMKGKGIVVVAGIVGINGDDDFAGQVQPAVPFFGRDFFLRLRGFGEDIAGEIGGEIVAADDGKGVVARVVLASNDFDEGTLGVDVAVGPFIEFDDDAVADPGLEAGGGEIDIDIPAEARVIRDDEMELAGFLQDADEGWLFSFQDADDPAATAAGGIHVAGGRRVVETNEDFVAVEGDSGVFGGDEDVVCSWGIAGLAVQCDKAEAFLVQADATAEESSEGGENQPVFAEADDDSFADELIQDPAHMMALGRRDAQGVNEFADAQGPKSGGEEKSLDFVFELF